jgi:hypothetical protein
MKVDILGKILITHHFRSKNHYFFAFFEKGSTNLGPSNTAPGGEKDREAGRIGRDGRGIVGLAVARSVA